LAKPGGEVCVSPENTSADTATTATVALLASFDHVYVLSAVISAAAECPQGRWVDGGVVCVHGTVKNGDIGILVGGGEVLMVVMFG
jgi:hypothetical protein